MDNTEQGSEIRAVIKAVDERKHDNKQGHIIRQSAERIQRKYHNGIVDILYPRIGFFVKNHIDDNADQKSTGGDASEEMTEFIPLVQEHIDQNGELKGYHYQHIDDIRPLFGRAEQLLCISILIVFFLLRKYAVHHLMRN